MDTLEPADSPDLSPYHRRWIAVVRGRVVGVGLTAEQAKRAARRVRPKDKLALYFVDAAGQRRESAMNSLSVPNLNQWLQQQPLLQTVVKLLQAQQIEAYLVGGAVRDLLLGRPQIIDLDFALPGDGLKAARRVADALEAAFYPLDEERGTGRVVLAAPESAQTYLDFASLRGPSLEADLADRDFTINAIALGLTGPLQLIDPLGGQADLAAGQIRVASDMAFNHDPVRVLRAVRQAAEFGFVIVPETERLISAAAAQLVTVSPERRRDELLKLLNTPAPGQAIQQLHRLGIIPYLLPELEPLVAQRQGPPHHLNVFDHTAAALEAWAIMRQTNLAQLPEPWRVKVRQELQHPLAGNLEQQTLLPLALLLHDTGKPTTYTVGPDNRVSFFGHEQVSATITRQVMQRFHFSSQAVDFVETVVAHHMRPLWLAAEDKLSRRAIYRFFKNTGAGAFQAGVAVALHALADQTATYPPGQGQAEKQSLNRVVEKLLAAYFEQREQMVDPPPLLTGRDLIDTLGLRQGSLIGRLLNRLKEAQAIGQVTDRAGALAFIQADPDYQRD